MACLVVTVGMWSILCACACDIVCMLSAYSSKLKVWTSFVNYCIELATLDGVTVSIK
jgi:hypothetical protein